MKMVRQDALTSADGTKLAFYQWDASGEVKANVLIVHGFAEHSGRYDHFATFLANARYQVYAVDLRGHGHSGGIRAYVKDVGEYADDLEAAITFIQTVSPEKKLFVHGHSMGGLVVVKTALDRKPSLAGVLLTSAGLKVDPDLSPMLQRLTPLIAMLAPKLKAVKLDASLVSRDPEVVKKYQEDPLVYHGGIKAGYAAAVLSTIKNLSGRFSEFEYPVLILHGEKDKLTDPAGSAQLAHDAGSSDLTHKVLPGLFHEILNEPEKEEIYSIMMEWLHERV